MRGLPSVAKGGFDMESQMKRKSKTLRQVLERIAEQNRDLDHQELFSWFDEQMLEVAVLKAVKRALSREAGKQWQKTTANGGEEE